MSTMIAEQTKQEIDALEPATKPALDQDFAVGDWRVQPQLNRIQLRDNSEERQLEPRLIKLLCFLAANEERVLSRNELVQELWPRVIVNENSLTRAISELRKQLQRPNPAATNYIETIPKRGYRLLHRVELNEEQALARTTDSAKLWKRLFSLSPLQYGTALSTACLCVLIAGWASLAGTNLLDRKINTTSESVLLSDQLLETIPDYLGGEIQLSTIDSNPSVVEAIATPVVSLDEKQYAFIQYDTQGSTIFLGGLGTAIEPVPVYYSNQYLFNLAWSPVGNNLLFGMKPSMTTAALYPTTGEMAELVTLNLNTLETSRLIKDLNPAEAISPNSLNLT